MPHLSLFHKHSKENIQSHTSNVVGAEHNLQNAQDASRSVNVGDTISASSANVPKSPNAPKNDALPNGQREISSTPQNGTSGSELDSQPDIECVQGGQGIARNG